MRRRHADLFLVPLLLISLTACTALEKSANFSRSIGAAVNRVVLTTDETTSGKDDITLLLAKQDYLAALRTIRQEVENGHSEHSLAGEYLEALQGVLRQANALMAEGVLDQAGRNFQAALHGFPREQELAQKAPLSQAGIQSKIDACADQLMEDGLLAYRAGDLDTAIEIWEQILSFLPQHEASQKAIHTANLQLNNLKSMDQKH